MARGISGMAVREWVLFLVGIGIIGFEVLIQTEPRFIVLALAGGMIGLPGFLYTDRKLSGSGANTAGPTPTLPTAEETSR